MARIEKSSSEWVICPEGQFVAKVIGETEPKHYNDKYGERDTQRIIFEILGKTKCTVLSVPYTLKISPLSNLTKLVKDITGESPKLPFETESLYGKLVDITVIQKEVDGNVYANIVNCRPHRKSSTETAEEMFNNVFPKDS